MVTDILMTDPMSGDVLVKANDIVLADANNQTVATLLMLRKGGAKWEPTVGIGLPDFLGSETFDGDRLTARISTELSEDGAELLGLEFGETLNVHAQY